MGGLRGHALFLRGARPCEELLARRLEDLPLLEDLAAEDEAAFGGYLGRAGELHAVSEDDAHPGRAGAARPARAVRIYGSLLGQVEAEDVGDARDVETARAQVAREEVSQLAAGEALEGDAASLLVHARMYGSDREAEGREGEGRLLDAGGHGEEHQAALGADRGLEAAREVQALAAVAVETPVLYAPGKDSLSDRAYLDGVAQEGPGFAADPLGNGGRHEDARAGRGRALEQGPRQLLGLVREEAVGLVEDEELEGGRAELAESHEIGEPAQGSDDDLGLGLELRGLLLEGRAAEEDHGLQAEAGGLGQALRLPADLHRELLRGRRDDDAGLAQSLALEDGDELEGGREVGESLSRARLRLDDRVPAREDYRDCVGLHRRRRGEAEGAEGGRQGVGEAEAREEFHDLMIARSQPPSQGVGAVRRSLKRHRLSVYSRPR